MKTIQKSYPIEVPPIIIVKKDLSTDQKYLLEIYGAASIGRVSEGFGKRSPRTLNHSRWLTTANRILRLYVSTNHPEEKLMTLVNFVMKVYVPMWFEIKAMPYADSGARYIFKALVKQQSKEVKEIVLPVMQRNAYFAHHENILLAMLADENETIRKLAWRRLKKCRQKKNPQKKYDNSGFQSLILTARITMILYHGNQLL